MEKQKLDGTETKEDLLTPFDAHEKVVRGPHTHSLEEGYKPVEPQPDPEPTAELIAEESKEE